MSIFAQDQGVLSLSLPVPGTTNKGRFPRLEQDSQVRDRSYNRLPDAFTAFCLCLLLVPAEVIQRGGPTCFGAVWSFHKVTVSPSSQCHLPWCLQQTHLCAAQQTFRFLKTEGTVTVSNTRYLSKSKNVELYDNSEMSTGLHFGTFLQYSNYIFFFPLMCTKPTT